MPMLALTGIWLKLPSTGLPASFNPGLSDCCFSNDESWDCPWCLPTLRTLMKMKVGAPATVADMFMEMRPWTVPHMLLPLRTTAATVL